MLSSIYEEAANQRSNTNNHLGAIQILTQLQNITRFLDSIAKSYIIYDFTQIILKKPSGT